MLLGKQPTAMGRPGCMPVYHDQPNDSCNASPSHAPDLPHSIPCFLSCCLSCPIDVEMTLSTNTARQLSPALDSQMPTLMHHNIINSTSWIFVHFPMQENKAAEGAAPAVEPLDTWVLLENTGRRYAALDGDISPMHLNKWMAMLNGFPAPVANVHFLGGRAEASLANVRGGCGEGCRGLCLRLLCKGCAALAFKPQNTAGRHQGE